jgi:hypothetical protein
MNRSQLIALANAVQAVRPDWQQAGILSQLEILNSTWAGTDGALAAHVMVIAGHPQARTPGALNSSPPPELQLRQAPQPGWREPICHTCSRTRSACVRLQQWELHHGVPDPHEFETFDDYLRKTRKSA